MNVRRSHGLAVACSVLALCAPAVARPASPPVPGIYLEMPGKSGDEARVRLKAELIQNEKQTGTAKMVISQGFAKAGIVGVIGGSSASVRVPSGDVAFYFYLDPKADSGSSQMNMEEAMKMMQGEGMPRDVKSADEFVLLRMTPKEDTRQAEIGTTGGFFGRGGGMGKSKDAVPCSVENLGGGAYRVRPKQPLAPGEYAFTVHSQAGGGAGGQFWDFGVDGR